MRRKIPYLILLLLIPTALITAITLAAGAKQSNDQNLIPLPQAFTYQGELRDDGVPAPGPS